MLGMNSLEALCPGYVWRQPKRERERQRGNKQKKYFKKTPYDTKENMKNMKQYTDNTIHGNNQK